MMVIIGIAGGTGSGKTTVARAIWRAAGDRQVALIPQDAYYRDNTHLSMGERSKVNYDHPDSFDNALLVSHLERLRQGEAVAMPVYDFTAHNRSAFTTPVTPKPVIILEGIMVLVDPQLRALLDIKVFVDTDPDIRILRRLQRDMNERGRTLESVLQQYIASVKPMHEAFIEPSKKYADIIIPEGGQNEVAIGFLTSWVSRRLEELGAAGEQVS